MDVSRFAVELSVRPWHVWEYSFIFVKKMIMKMSEENIDFFETQIPDLAELAFQKAYWHNLSSGNTVTVLEDDKIVEISPDGKKRVIKTLPRHEKRITQKYYTIK
jgi:hypothetical protein